MTVTRLLTVLTLSMPSAASAGAQTPDPVRVQTGGSATATAVGTTSLQDTHDGTVAATVVDVWRVLPAVYESLSIPITLRDSASMQIGNGGLQVRRMLGGTMVSRYFTCGNTSGGASALTYELFVMITTQVSAALDGGTRIATQMTVKGKPMSYSGGWIPCGSSTSLEQRIVDGVNQQLKR